MIGETKLEKMLKAAAKAKQPILSPIKTPIHDVEAVEVIEEIEVDGEDDNEAERTVRFEEPPPPTQQSLLRGLAADDFAPPTQSQSSSPTQIVPTSSTSEPDEGDDEGPPSKIRRVGSTPSDLDYLRRASLAQQSTDRSLGAESSQCTITPEVPYMPRFEPPPLQQTCALEV